MNREPETDPPVWKFQVALMLLGVFIMAILVAFSERTPELCVKHMDNWKCEVGETMRILVRYSDRVPFVSCERDHEIPENARIAEEGEQ